MYNIFVDPINPIAGNPKVLNQNPEPPKDNHWITIASMAVFVLLSLAAVVFLYYQNQNLKALIASNQNRPTPSPTFAPTSTATPTCKPRPACLDTKPRCLIPETPDMCPPSPTPSPRACTQEAKLCSNGSYVGRTGPNCEFAPCPTSGY